MGWTRTSCATLGVLAIVASGCTAGAHHGSVELRGPGVGEGHGIRVTLPSGWVVAQEGRFMQGNGQGLGFIASTAALLPCRIVTASCNSIEPGGLTPNSVFASWGAVGPLGAAIQGTATVVDGRPATMRWDTPPVQGTCGAKADTELSIEMLPAVHGSAGNLLFHACLRGPDIANLRTAIMSVVHSTRFPAG